MHRHDIRHSTLAAGLVLLVFICPVIAQPIDYLPEVLRDQIEAWRARIESAGCLKVVRDTDQTWVRLYQTDETGEPSLARRERFQSHTWMTPDMVWVTIFAYDGDEVDTSKPYNQTYWDRETRIVRERFLHPENGSFHVRRYVDEAYEFGPSNLTVSASRGCVAPATSSWLIGGPGFENRCGSVRTVTFERSPNLAVVPYDPAQRGVWFDVIRELPERDRYQNSADRLYRRNDGILLAHNEAGEPEVREWRTVVLTDETDGGNSPTEITGIRRFRYQFFDSPPADLLSSVEAFALEVDELVAREKAAEE